MGRAQTKGGRKQSPPSAKEEGGIREGEDILHLTTQPPRKTPFTSDIAALLPATAGLGGWRVVFYARPAVSKLAGPL